MVLGKPLVADIPPACSQQLHRHPDHLRLAYPRQEHPPLRAASDLPTARARIHTPASPLLYARDGLHERPIREGPVPDSVRHRPAEHDGRGHGRAVSWVNLTSSSCSIHTRNIPPYMLLFRLSRLPGHQDFVQRRTHFQGILQAGSEHLMVSYTKLLVLGSTFAFGLLGGSRLHSRFRVGSFFLPFVFVHDVSLYKSL